MKHPHEPERKDDVGNESIEKDRRNSSPKDLPQGEDPRDPSRQAGKEAPPEKSGDL